MREIDESVMMMRNDKKKSQHLKQNQMYPAYKHIQFFSTQHSYLKGKE